MLLIVPFLLTACSVMEPAPSRSLKEAGVVEGPVIIQRESNYFLSYRRKLENGKHELLLPVNYRRTGDTGCYYFYGPVSSSYFGQRVEYPLVYDEGATDLARAGKIFWLNPDGSKVKIPVRREN